MQPGAAAPTDAAAPHPHKLGEEERQLLRDLRAKRRRERKRGPGQAEPPLTPGQRIADGVAATMGSWRFIIVQTTILAFWIGLNITAWVRHWDPYPFILLNLALSFQAAYAAPFIMMSQNRQADVDRLKAEDDYRINVKAELEIELLHQKLDELREREMLTLARSVERLTALLESKRG
ncbi:MAG: DUF1003 domain-containing protein [Alphaproteobacteria bacterium]|nr:DUF1003 domain-containing protein [Alphaproteobacteria bacterium]MBV9371619.1 DUF1003 domain-containing protein [Alphaproteobacteria bacterium]MBV9901038.1 DUF1003 domain-containing protein [Alphaproteobacteria bacterium]